MHFKCQINSCLPGIVQAVFSNVQFQKHTTCTRQYCINRCINTQGAHKSILLLQIVYGCVCVCVYTNHKLILPYKCQNVLFVLHEMKIFIVLK